MKQTRIFSFLFLMVAALGVFAQPSKVTTGIIAHDQGRYDETILKLKEALAKPDLLKPKDIAKANYYMASAMFKVYSSPELSKKMEGQFGDLLLETTDAYAAAMTTLKDAPSSEKSVFAGTLEIMKTQLFAQLVNNANEMYMQVKDGDPEGAKKAEPVMQYLTKAAGMNADSYLPTLLMGFLSLKINNNAGVVSNLEKAIATYEKSVEATKTIDTTMGSAYLALSNAHLETKNTAKALEVVEKGKKAFPNNREIAKQELAIYQSDPSYLEQALGKFKAAIEKNPKDNTVRIAYADMLTRAGKPEEGIEEYRTVLKNEPNNFYANANLGAHYVNTAALINEELKKPESDYESLNKQIVENFKLAYPYVKKAQELKPNEMEWVEQMLQITSYLIIDDPKMVEEMNRYSAMKKKLQGQ